MTGRNLLLIKETPTQRFFQKAAAARYLGISPSTLLRITAKGIVRSYVFCGRRVWLLEDLDKLIETADDWRVVPKLIKPKN